jgi:hypothetical protein
MLTALLTAIPIILCLYWAFSDQRAGYLPIERKEDHDHTV